MDLASYRASEKERLRTDDLMRLMPKEGIRALDIGAREGYFSRLMAERFEQVVALDLERPTFEHPGVTCVAGNAAALDFPDRHFDLVFCAEVLEHVPTGLLAAACREMVRVCRGHLVIGVPERQDLRVGRTTCQACGRGNPPWGHVNSFDEARLRQLFDGCEVIEVSHVGTNDEHTSDLSAWLMDRAGNPYGTYEQDEACVHCGQPLGRPGERTLAQKLLTKAAFWTRALSRAPDGAHGNWIHLLLRPQAPG